jgi:hypothetical protein
VIFVVLAMAVSLANSSELADQLDLPRLLADSAALQRLIVLYKPNPDEVLFVYGSGKVVKQAHRIDMSDALVPTCTGQIAEVEVRELVTAFIDHHFLDLPTRSYALILASDDVDEYWRKLKLHSIIIDDGRVRAKRDFAEGEYLGKKEPIPADFIAIESLLKTIEKRATSGGPCHIAPGIKLPPVDYRPQYQPPVFLQIAPLLQAPRNGGWSTCNYSQREIPSLSRSQFPVLPTKQSERNPIVSSKNIIRIQ